MRINLGRPARSSHTKEDLADKRKWCFGDLEDFAQILRNIEKTVILANKLKDQFVPLMRNAKSDQLKGDLSIQCLRTSLHAPQKARESLTRPGSNVG